MSVKWLHLEEIDLNWMSVSRPVFLLSFVGLAAVSLCSHSIAWLVKLPHALTHRLHQLLFRSRRLNSVQDQPVLPLLLRSGDTAEQVRQLMEAGHPPAGATQEVSRRIIFRALPPPPSNVFHETDSFVCDGNLIPAFFFVEPKPRL